MNYLKWRVIFPLFPFSPIGYFTYFRLHKMEKSSSFGLLYWLLWVHTRDRSVQHTLCWELALKAVSKRACGNVHAFFCIFLKLILWREKITLFCLVVFWQKSKASSGLRLYIKKCQFSFRLSRHCQERSTVPFSIPSAFSPLTQCSIISFY